MKKEGFMRTYYKSIDEQIQLLKSRGLFIDNEARAKKVLLHYNFYKVINGTRLFLSKPGDPYRYRKGVTFHDVEAIHEFDKAIKKHFLNAVLDIERHLRSIVSYVFMKHHPEEEAYLKTENFNKNKALVSANTHTLTKTIEKYKEEKNYEKSIAYYFDKYDHVPLWFLINFVSLGKLVNFYQTMKAKEQYEVANLFTDFLYENIEEAKGYYITSQQFESFILNIREIRNVVAHDNMILNYLCDASVAFIGPIHDEWQIRKEDDRSNVFNVYLIMQAFLSRSQFRKLTFNLQEAIDVLKKEVDPTAFTHLMRALGFPEKF